MGKVSLVEVMVEHAKFNGTWVLTQKDGEKFEAYLKALGIGLIKRKVAKNMGRTITFEALDGGNFHIVSASSLKTNDVKLSLGVTVDGERDDGVPVATVFQMENGCLVQNEETKDGKTKYEHTW